MNSEEKTHRIGLILEYDGTRYSGFQYQTGVPTIQGEIEKAVTSLTGEHRRVQGASRTDAGVHACGQVVSLRTKAEYSTEVFRNALNHYLPDDISVREAVRLNEGFDVRRGAVSREYRYYMLNRGTRSALSCRWAYQVPLPMDVEAMNEASRQLIGEHDFASFVSDYEKGSTRRTVLEAFCERLGEMVVFHMKANSFLAHQVRNTVGMLVQVGNGKLGVDCVRSLLDARTPGMAGPSAPAQGLFLTRVNYPQPLGAI